ncbi:hypothetical protein D3C86_1959470 [compost metagenome]
MRADRQANHTDFTGSTVEHFAQQARLELLVVIRAVVSNGSRDSDFADVSAGCWSSDRGEWLGAVFFADGLLCEAVSFRGDDLSVHG